MSCRTVDGYAFVEFDYSVKDRNPGVDTDEDGRADEGNIGYMEQVTDASDIDIPAMSFESTGRKSTGFGGGLGVKGCIPFTKRADAYTDKFTQMYWRAALRGSHTSMQFRINNLPDLSGYDGALKETDLLFDRKINTFGLTTGAGYGPIYMGGSVMLGRTKLAGSNGNERFMTPNGYFYPDSSGYDQQAAWVVASSFEFALSPRPLLPVKNPDRGNVEWVAEWRNSSIRPGSQYTTNSDNPSTLYREEDDDLQLRTDIHQGTQPVGDADHDSGADASYSINSIHFKLRASF
jgi:hypothetical protein